MTLRDAVREALAAWMMFEADGGRADYDRLVPKMTALRAALAQEEAGPSRAALMELFEAIKQQEAGDGEIFGQVGDALARCEREAKGGGDATRQV